MITTAGLAEADITRRPAPRGALLPALRYWPVILGALLITIPTLIRIAQRSWSSEQGAHGPIVLAIAIWLVARSWGTIMAERRPGSPLIGGLILACVLPVYVFAHILGSLVVESLAVYLALLATLYLFVGHAAMRRAWFALAYPIFMLPPPGTAIAIATQPLRLGISEQAVNLLSALGYPTAREGLSIFVAQYELQVKAACGGLNSMISLTAVGLFYSYMRHGAGPAYHAFLFVVIVAMAMFANFVRVILLILITYYLGEGAAQGFLHDFAGLTMFVVAMGGIFLVDRLVSHIHRRLTR